MLPLILKRKAFFVLALPLIFLPACSSPSTSQKTAEDFIQAYYVNHDQQAAINFSAGLATEKLREEMGLLKGTTPATPQEKPKVEYRKISSNFPSDEEARWIYQLTILIPDLNRKIERKVFLILRKEGEAWRVTQFGDNAGAL